MRDSANRARLYVAVGCIWLASRIAPRPMDAIFRAHLQMLVGFPEQINRGRTYGIMIAGWQIRPEDEFRAMRLQLACALAARRERVAIEAEQAS